MKPCDYLDGASRRDKTENLGTPGKERWIIEIKNFVEPPGNEITHLDETRIRITLCLSFIN